MEIPIPGESCASVGNAKASYIKKEIEKVIIDIHSHIIPSVDDGAISLEDAVYMAQTAINCGVERIVATPHYNHPLCESLERIRKAYLALLDALEYEQIALKIDLGMEIYASPDLPALLREEKVYTYPGSKYFLVEFDPNLPFKIMDKLLRECEEDGFIPVVAHPERYTTVQRHPERIEAWTERGYGLQVNRDSLMGRFGDAAYECADFLMCQCIANCIASDSHSGSDRSTYWGEDLERLIYRYGYRKIIRCIERNPERIINNQKIRN